ncbi:MAG: hypothetical protein CPDRYMAC_0749 [uncultured Paraburkholderia sp.]|nr:MAG: hypothetical protein CPDRYDRY_0721 [uncultured Paraburkholderia sp.]CAH2913658.1 MAG: hypothetical protein CPDRYMAC_0749 [uncultured Paraburkholderia sp.]
MNTHCAQSETRRDRIADQLTALHFDFYDHRNDMTTSSPIRAIVTGHNRGLGATLAEQLLERNI